MMGMYDQHYDMEIYHGMIEDAGPVEVGGLKQIFSTTIAQCDATRFAVAMLL
jgi:hypothetical protein